MPREIVGVDPFPDLPDPDAGPGTVLAALRAADWDGFRALQHLPALRAALTGLERRHGITEAHRYATGRLRAAGARLRHSDPPLTEITATALSPCGRHLVVGCYDDVTEGGWNIWEVATGRCLTAVSWIDTEVGRYGHARLIQWSADGNRIAADWSIGQVGLWEPFDNPDKDPLTTVSGHDGDPDAAIFALAPDGDRLFRVLRAPDGFGVHGALLPLQPGEENDDENSDEIDWPVSTLPAEVRERLGDDELFFDRVYWSRDGRHVYGYDRDRTWSIDLECRAVSWMVGSGGWYAPRPAWSLDEQWFAMQPQDRLVFCNTSTGEPLADVPGYPGRPWLSWGANGPVRRLAVVVPHTQYDTSIPGRVAVYDDAVHRYDLDIPIGSADPDDTDAAAWSWAPDGRHAAAVTADGDVEVWRLDDVPRRVREVAGASDTHGVLWGADNVLILVGRTTLRFVQAHTGEVFGDHTFGRKVSGERHLKNDELGFLVSERVTDDPEFTLDGGWGVAFTNGVVAVADIHLGPDRVKTLDRRLAWVVEQRYAWPVRWGDLTVVPDVRSALSHVPDLADLDDTLAADRVGMGANGA